MIRLLLLLLLLLLSPLTLHAQTAVERGVLDRIANDIMLVGDNTEHGSKYRQALDLARMEICDLVRQDGVVLFQCLHPRMALQTAEGCRAAVVAGAHIVHFRAVQERPEIDATLFSALCGGRLTTATIYGLQELLRVTQNSPPDGELVYKWSPDQGQ